MRQATWAVLAALLLLGGCQPGPGVSGGGGRWPGGDWAESCRDATLRGGTLLARCRERDGDWRSTSIRYEECPGNRLRNDNGRLVCAGGGGWDDDDAWTSGGPRGSWAQSCRQAQVSGSRLTAMCRDRDGRYQRSSIVFTSCRGNRVANRDGRLRCDG